MWLQAIKFVRVSKFAWNIWHAMLAGALNSYLITRKFAIHLAHFRKYQIYEFLMNPKLNRFTIYVKNRKKLKKKTKKCTHTHIHQLITWASSWFIANSVVALNSLCICWQFLLSLHSFFSLFLAAHNISYHIRREIQRLCQHQKHIMINRSSAVDAMCFCFELSWCNIHYLTLVWTISEASTQ